MTTIDVLTRAKERIANPARWTTRASARTAKGFVCMFDGVDAVSWCAMGAIRLEGGLSTEWIQAIHTLGRACIMLGAHAPERFNPVSSFNDSKTHDEVLAAFDLAIHLAGATPEGRARG